MLSNCSFLSADLQIDALCNNLVRPDVTARQNSARHTWCISDDDDVSWVTQATHGHVFHDLHPACYFREAAFGEGTQYTSQGTIHTKIMNFCRIIEPVRYQDLQLEHCMRLYCSVKRDCYQDL